MNTFQELKNWAETQKAQGHFLPSIGDLHVQIYESSPLQLNIRVNSQQEACLKLEERVPGRFTFAAAPCKNRSIDFTKTRVFTMTESIELLLCAFPDEDIRRIVDILIDC